MEPSGWCHFNFRSPNRSKTRPPTCLSLLSFSSPLPTPIEAGRGWRPKGRSVEEGGWRDRGLVAGARDAPAGEEALVASGYPAASRSGFAVVSLERGLGRFRAAKFYLRMDWVADRGQKLWEAGTGILIEMILPRQTD